MRNTVLAAGSLAAGLLAAACLTAGGVVAYINSRACVRTFRESGEAFGNPLMGYAPGAGEEQVAEDVQLLYVDITWRELEPEEGRYAWEEIARDNQLSRWRAEGKHIVLRFVCDKPGDEAHMDIPDWLYERMDGAGTWYDMEYGRGFSPDYANEEFIRCHARAVEAMGRQLGQDGFVSYVELGSLGHWGEWHVNYGAGIHRLPPAPVRERYVVPWTEAFPRAKLLMRRPFAEAKAHGLGLYNDMAGEPESTREWLDWIARGGAYDQTGEEQGLVPMEDAWKQAPVGGEFTSSLSMESMLQADLARTEQLVRDSHMTFLGPKAADQDYADGYRAVLKDLGYRVWISRAVLKKQGRHTVLTLTWENTGSAPMYADWPVMAYVEDEDGAVLEAAPVELGLSGLLPGTQAETSVAFRLEGLVDEFRKGSTPEGSHRRITVGIVDPMTGKDAVRLAVEGEPVKLRTLLFP